MGYTNMTIMPYVIERTAAGERSYDIFSRLLNDRIIMLTGEVCDEMAASITSQLLFLDSVDPGKIFIYTLTVQVGLLLLGWLFMTQ